ncbi:MAG: ParB/RepB/Spo0J family partition protein [Gemmatimonadaceae bacterium]|nr:ParB/RepB/Spo0J family partition protein [Gemmatimonadaceae bacterium]
MNPPEPPRRLGRGLDALLARREPSRDASSTSAGRDQDTKGSTEETPKSALQSLAISQIRANPFQPRQEFRPEDLADLESSLRTNGLLQPITVRPAPGGNGYELIAGERRFRAATRLGWTEIPAIVRETDDRTLLTLAMVENLQRADLDPIEEADGYHRLMDEFQLSQQEVADVVGKDRSTVANALRLRQLPAAVRRLLQEKQLSAGHARALLPLVTERAIIDLAREIVAQGFSVREVERRVQAGRPKPATSGRKAGPSPTAPVGASSAEVRRIEELLRKKLQTGVNIHLSAKDRGEVRIAFFSNDDLERVLEVLGVKIDS